MSCKKRGSGVDAIDFETVFADKLINWSQIVQHCARKGQFVAVLELLHGGRLMAGGVTAHQVVEQKWIEMIACELQRCKRNSCIEVLPGLFLRKSGLRFVLRQNALSLGDRASPGFAIPPNAIPG